MDNIVRRAVARTLNSHRILAYSVLSTLAVVGVIVNALKSYGNFYSVTIYLSKSSRSVLVLANFAILLTLLGGHIVQKIFFGTLRTVEIERLHERLWFFITESLLAFTIFRDEFDIPFALMFGFLLFVTSFHWLAGDRIEWMDQRPYPGPSLLFHVRMTILFLILLVTDLAMFYIAIESTMTKGVGGMVLFASEYGILMASLQNTMAKYFLSAYEFRRASQRGGENAPPWENKSMWIFYVELATDFMKLTTYLVFFGIIITFFGLPLNIVRDVYLTARSFFTRLRALHRYQAATRNMDQRYPNATTEEFAQMSDKTCIICRDEMSVERPADGAAPDGPNTTPKKLPCGHIFHFHCLRSWLERQQSCPTCRRTVFDTNPAPAQNTPAPAAAAAQNPGQGNNNNNDLLGNNPAGLYNRFFGPPPPVAGGAGVPPGLAGQLPPNIAIALGQANNGQGQGGQGPVTIQYTIQYQAPVPAPGTQGQTQQQQQATERPPLQPIPQFAGFHDPRGVWQPWNRPQGNIPTPSPTTPAATPETQETTATLPEPAAAAEDPTPAPTPTSSTPREAAAAAALRRFNSSRTGQDASGSSQAAAPPPPSTSENPGSVPKPEATAAPAVNPTTVPSSSKAREVNAQLPQLIPLHDAFTLPSNSFGRQPNSYRSYREPTLNHTRSSSLLQRPLPSNLTEQQLSMMDRVTREAIDERLKVLEGVSVSVNRAIDDLMRMRSVLPVPLERTDSNGEEDSGPSVAPVQPAEQQPSVEGSSPPPEAEQTPGKEGVQAIREPVETTTT